HPALVVPGVAKSGHHLASEELHVLERQLVRHRTDLQEHHQIADAKPLDDFFLESITDGRWAAGDDVALLDEVSVAKSLEILGATAHRIRHGRDEASVVLVSGRREPLNGPVQARSEEHTSELQSRSDLV